MRLDHELDAGGLQPVGEALPLDRRQKGAEVGDRHGVAIDGVGPDHTLVTIDAVARVIAAHAPDLSERVRVVGPGDLLDLGVPVRVVGEKHAVIHPDYPRFDNSGYLLTCGDQSVYHPGDALTPPGEAIDVLLAPISAPWLKMSEAVDFVREVRAPRSLGIHDKVYSDLALGMVDTHMANLVGDLSFVRVPDGADLE